MKLGTNKVKVRCEQPTLLYFVICEKRPFILGYIKPSIDRFFPFFVNHQNKTFRKSNTFTKILFRCVFNETEAENFDRFQQSLTLSKRVDPHQKFQETKHKITTPFHVYRTRK